MGAGHGHGHGHGRGHGHGLGHAHGHPPAPGHAGARYRVRLAAAFGLTAAFFVVELLAALASGSLALLSDAGHMAADVVALGAALLATVVATRPDGSGRRTYGRYRAEIFASGLAVLIMLGVGVYVLVEAVGRIGGDAPVASGTMLLVGALGLAVNVAAIALLRSGSRESLNVRGAYLEVVADAAGSVGVMVAAVLIRVTGSPVWDLVVAVTIAVFVVVRAALLGRQVLAVLGQHAPEGLDPAEVAASLGAIDGVGEVHDLHLWTLTSGMHVGTVHLVVHDRDRHMTALREARTVLLERYGIDHVTVQVESPERDGCHELDW